jgi:hypothetical protein
MADVTDDLLWLDTGLPTTFDRTSDTILGLQLSATAGESITAADIIVAYDDSGSTKVRKANASISGRQEVVGVATTGGIADATINVAFQGGAMVAVKFGSAPAAASNGSPVYLDTTSGQATLTAPSGASDVIFRIGRLYGADGADTTPTVILDLQYIAKLGA